VKTCEYDGAPFTEPRSHPWTDAVSCAGYRYIDLKADPSRIRTSLEDFVPFGHHAAIGDFYALVEWLNGPRSTLESNDCAFTGPQANDIPSVAKALVCSGRIMVLFSELTKNLSRPAIESLKDALHHRLMEIDTAFPWGIIGTTILPVRYVTLPVPEEQKLGHQLMISFWAWGSPEEELMTNLGRVLRNLSRGLHEVVVAGAVRA
jgi:hypothetical protein